VTGLAGLRIGVCAGRRGAALVDELARRGALPLWAPLGDVGPARRGVPAAELIRAMGDGELDALAFTSPPAVEGLFSKAAELGLEQQVHDGLAGRALTGPAATRVLVAALCPATAGSLERRGVGVVVCPLQPSIPALAAALVAAPIGFRSFGRIEPLSLDPQGRIVTGPGGAAELSDLQFALLAALARRPGLTCPPGVLLREVWGDGRSAGPGARRRLEVLASRLRARLAPIQVNVATVPKRGYRLELAARALGADEGPAAR
jgi:uroporphyrinogen-III synthase